MTDGAEPDRGAAPRFSRRAAVVLLSVAAVAALFALFALVRPKDRRTTTGEEEENSPATLTVSAADLHEEPRSNARSLERLARGARLRVLSDRGDWIQVRTERRATGYLPAGALERDSDRENRKKRGRTILSYPPLFGVVAEDADVLLAPFPLAPHAGRLRRGATVRVHSVDHAYYAIRADDGELAFVESSRVDLVPPDPRQPAIVPPPDAKPLKNLTVINLELPEAPADEEALVETLPPPGPAPPPVPPAGPPLEPAVLVSKVDPPYPELARRMGVDGTVVLEVLIGADGRVADARVVSGQPAGLSEAAAAAVRRWRYRPARGPDGPVASRKEVRILFRLGR